MRRTHLAGGWDFDVADSPAPRPSGYHDVMTNDPAAPSPDNEQRKTKVFISYSRKDLAFADRLEQALKARGLEPMIDRSEILAFEDWWKRIEDLIAQSDTIVFVLSPDALSSDVCNKEVAFAASLNKRFAPI